MRLFLYEFITGGGLPGSSGPVPVSLFREGAAMITALACDFVAIPGTQVTVLRDPRLPGLHFPGCEVLDVTASAAERTLFESAASAADWTVVIAPESDGALAERCRWVLAAGGRLLGPPLAVVELAADKNVTARHLAASGVPVPFGVVLRPGDCFPTDFPYPAVLKPIDGAGSQDTFLIASCEATRPPLATRSMRLEHYHPGQAASVSFLCGPAGAMGLPPCGQELSDDGRFSYLGGFTPLGPAFAERAARLAARAIASLATPLGYLGIDLVLGPDAAGRDDVVIEINPRLSTSYVGLRAAAQTNLAQAMLEIAVGARPNIRFRPERIHFQANGTIDT